MKTPITFLALLASVSASSAFTLSRTYGSALACQRYAAGGVVGVYTDGPSNGLATDHYLLIRPHDILGLEWGCELPTKIPAGTMTLKCHGEGEEWTVSVRLSIRPDGALVYDDGEAIAVPQCSE
jgi:hypothetical protein